MKKILVLLTLAALLVVTSSCKEKRCACVSKRLNYPDAYSYEPLQPGGGCIDTLEYPASDSISIIVKYCKEED